MLTITGTGVGSGVEVLVGEAVIVGVGVSDATIIRFGVGVSVGNNCSAPTHEESSSVVNVNSKTEKRIELIIFPSFHPMGVCECSVKHNG